MRTMPDKLLSVTRQLSKVGLGLFGIGGAETFVVLYVPALGVGALLPILVLWHGVEGQHLLALGRLHQDSIFQSNKQIYTLPGNDYKSAQISQSSPPTFQERSWTDAAAFHGTNSSA